MYTLQIDKREHRSDIGKEIYDLFLEYADEFSYKVEDQNQVLGDYCWYNEDGSHTGIAVELKIMATDDFFNSLRNGHMDSQMLDLCQMTYPLLVVVGAFDAKHYNGIFTRKQFIAKLASIEIRTGVKAIWFERVSDAVQFMIQLPVQLEKGSRCDVIAVRHKSTKNRLDYNLNQFLSLPSIGEKRAHELHDLFPTFLKFLENAVLGTIDGLPKDTYEYVAAITGVPLSSVVPLYKQFQTLPGIGEKNARDLSLNYPSLADYIECVKCGTVKAPKKTLEHILQI